MERKIEICGRFTGWHEATRDEAARLVRHHLHNLPAIPEAQRPAYIEAHFLRGASCADVLPELTAKNAALSEGDRVRVHLYDTAGREIVTRHFGDVFTVRRENSALGIDWNTERSPYTCRGEIFTPFSTFATSVIFEQVGTGYRFYWDNIADALTRKEATTC